MEIRVATLNDIAPICELYNEFFAYNARIQPEYYNAGRESGGYPQSVIESQSSDIFVAVEGGVIVEFIHIREARTPPFDAFVPHNFAEVIDFIVTAAYRKKRLALS